MAFAFLLQFINDFLDYVLVKLVYSSQHRLALSGWRQVRLVLIVVEMAVSAVASIIPGRARASRVALHDWHA
jgi:hypothetical protein